MQKVHQASQMSRETQEATMLAKAVASTVMPALTSILPLSLVHSSLPSIPAPLGISAPI